MGSDNVYVKFGTDADQDKWTEADWAQIDSGYNSESGDRIVINTNDGGFYNTLLRDTIQDVSWDAVTRVWFNASIVGNMSGAFIKLSDDNYYVFGAETVGSSVARYAYDKTTTRPSAGYNTMTDIATGLSIRTDIWVGLRFHTNGLVDFIASDSAGNRDPPTMSTIAADIFGGVPVNAFKINEIGVYGDGTGMEASYLRLFIAADLPTPLGGDADLENPIDIIVRSSLGSMGIANLEFIEKDIASKIATIISNHRKSVTINAIKNGMAVFIGEITKTPHSLYNYGYTVEEISRKLLRTPTLTNPIKESGKIRHIGKDPVVSTKTIIDDIDKDYTVNVNVNDLVTFDQQTTNKLKATPDFAGIQWLEEDPDDTFNTFIPLGTTGNISNCYFDDQTLPVADNQIGGDWKISGVPSFAKAGLVVFFYYSVKVGNTVTELEFNLDVAFRKLSHYLAGNYPKFRVWNYIFEGWNEKYQLVAADVGGKSSEKDDDDVFGHDESTTAKIKIQIDTSATQYADKITSNSGADEFNRYETKIFIQTFTTLSIAHNTIHFYKGTLDVILDTEQDGLLELGKVGAVAANRLDFQDFQGRQPFMDGMSNDDKYYVTDIAATVLANALVNSGLDANFTLDIDMTGITTLAIFQDYIDKSFWELVQYVCTALNGFWYINPGTKAITMRTSDTAEDTGIELDDTDVYNYHDQIFRNTIDSTNLRTKIKVIGDKVDSGNVSISPEFGSTFGDETEIINKPEVETVTEVSTVALAQATRFSKADRLMTFPINLTTNSKNLTALGLGKLVTVKIPADGSIIDYSGDNKVLIYAMDYEKSERSGQEEILYLQLQRRF